MSLVAPNWRCKGGRTGRGDGHGARDRNRSRGRGRAVKAQDVRVDRVPWPGPVDAGQLLAGVRGRSQRKGQALAAQLGTHHVDPIPDEPDPVLHRGDDHALEPGERRGTPVGSVRAAVAPRRRRTASRWPGTTRSMAPRGMHDDLYAGAIVIEAGGREAALVGTTTGRSQGTATGTRTFSPVVQPTGLLSRLPAVSRCPAPRPEEGGDARRAASHARRRSRTG